MTPQEKEITKVLSDAFTEYRQAYRPDEKPDTLLYPRNEYPDIISYQTAKVLEYLRKSCESTMLIPWFEKVNKRLAEYEYFSPSETYLFEAQNLIAQLELVLRYYENEPR